MKLEILDSGGNVVDEIPTSKRRGLNRVTWSMLTKPPIVPPAASIAGSSTSGERVLPGNYTVRLTDAGAVTTEPLTITLDRRARFTLADRQAQYGATERLKDMFKRMTTLVGQINGVRDQAAALSESSTASADVKAAAQQIDAKADVLRKEIVATTEGGAITGEERLREHVDEIYGAINSVEDRPTDYQLARIDALDRELKDVESQWAAFRSNEIAPFNAKLNADKLPPVAISSISFDPDDLPRGGPIEALAAGLVGTHFYGDLHALQRETDKN